ncbi:MAG: hypothetical protein ACYSTI_14370 [Planctomycetota bacterium]
MKRILLSIVVMAVVMGYSRAQADWRDYYTWEVVIWQYDGVEKAKLKIGTAPTATELYDPIYEVDAYFAGSLKSYFYHPEWGRSAKAGATDYFWSDIRSESLPQTWDFEVVADRIGDVTLSWDLSHLEAPGCSSIELTLIDNKTGQAVSFTDTPSYVYYNDLNSPHSFTVTAAEVPGSDIDAPTGLMSNPGGGHVTLRWTDDARAAGFRVYRDAGLISGDTLVTDVDGDGRVVFSDKDVKKGKVEITYTYAVTAVTPDGCESETAEIEVSR